MIRIPVVWTRPKRVDEEFRQALAHDGVRHTRIRAGQPQSNGCVERVHQTILEECFRPTFARALIPRFTALRADLAHYLRYYNHDRARTGRRTQDCPPAEVLGAAKMWPHRSSR